MEKIVLFCCMFYYMTVLVALYRYKVENGQKPFLFTLNGTTAKGSIKLAKGKDPIIHKIKATTAETYYGYTRFSLRRSQQFMSLEEKEKYYLANLESRRGRQKSRIPEDEDRFIVTMKIFAFGFFILTTFYIMQLYAFYVQIEMQSSYL